MCAVIFKAEIRVLHAEFAAMARRMRDLAIDQYGCLPIVQPGKYCRQQFG